MPNQTKQIIFVRKNIQILFQNLFAWNPNDFIKK